MIMMKWRGKEFATDRKKDSVSPKSVNFKDFARGEVRAKREMINEVTVKLLQD